MSQITQQLIYRCTAKACREKHVEEAEVSVHLEAMRPGVPVGWHLVDGRLYCQDHEVVVDPDRQGWKKVEDSR